MREPVVQRISSILARKTSNIVLADEVIEWLEKLQSAAQPWSLFLTITMRRLDPVTGQTWNIGELDKALVTFLWRLESLIFNKAARIHKRRLGRIAARHLGDYRDNPHFHVVLTCPINLSEADLRTLVVSAARKIKWINGDPHITKYYSNEAIGYLMSDPDAELVVEAIARAN